MVGTPGLSDAQTAVLVDHGRAIPIVFAANMSVGVNVLLSLVESAARALGSAYDIEIVEMHHRHKVDAPSGTARRLGEAAAAGIGRSADLVEGIIGLMVENRVRAFPPDKGAACFGAAGGENGEASGAGELHGGETDAASRTVDEEGLACLGLAAMKEGEVRCGIRHTERRAQV